MMGSLLAFISAASYASGYLLVRTGVKPGDPDGGAFVTTVVNAALLGSAAIVALALAGPVALAPAGIAWFAVAGVLGPFTGRILMFAGIHRLGPARAAAVVNSAPLITVFLAVTVLGATLSAADLVAVGLVIVGLATLMAEAFQEAGSVDDERFAAGPTSDDPALDASVMERARSAAVDFRRRYGTAMMIGILLAGGSAISFGFARTARRLGLDWIPDPLIGAAAGAAFGLLTHLVVQGAQGRLTLLVRSTVLDPRPRLWLAGALSALGLLTFFAALTFAPLAQVAVIAASETILTLLLTSIFLRRTERFSLRLLVPAGCIFAGAVVIAVG
jgi:drug/metabolite transporter (DMT)-like permease